MSRVDFAAMADDAALEAQRIRGFLWKRRVFVLACASPFLLCLLLPSAPRLFALPPTPALIVIVVVWFGAIMAANLALRAAQCPRCRRLFTSLRSVYPTACQECGFPIP